MRNSWFLLSLFFSALFQTALAQTGSLELIGHAIDQLGNRATIAIVNLDRDRYLALSVKNDDKPDDATFALLKHEVPKLLDMIEKGARTKKNLKEGGLEILNSFEGHDSGLGVIRVNLAGTGTITVLQVTENGKECQFLLDQKSWTSLDALIRKAEKRL